MALEVIKGQKTTNEIASEYGVHPTQSAQLKKQVLEEVPQMFSGRRKKAEQAEEVYLKGYASVTEANRNLKEYFVLYK